MSCHTNLQLTYNKYKHCQASAHVSLVTNASLPTITTSSDAGYYVCSPARVTCNFSTQMSRHVTENDLSNAKQHKAGNDNQSVCKMVMVKSH